MKISIYIVLLLSIGCHCGCTTSPHDGPDETPVRGLMSVEILEENGLLEERLETVRFIVFKQAKTNPQVELNRRFDIPAAGSGPGEVSRFRIVLELGMRNGGTNDKIVVAIINEPSETSGSLDACETYDQLHKLELDMNAFVQPDHLALRNGKTMPMTGVAWTDKVYPDLSSARADPVEIELERVLAKVELYFRKEPGVDFDIASGTKISLSNTYDREYFVRAGKPPHAFGMIGTVTASAFIMKEWSHTGSPIPIPESGAADPGLLLCSFYTPERTCDTPDNADKLVVGLALIDSEAHTRTATAVLAELRRDNILTPLLHVERNNTYRIIVTVTDKDLELLGLVTEWNNEDIEIEF